MADEKQVNSKERETDEEKKKLAWFDPRSEVNREDYLLGKRIGKDLTLISDTFKGSSEDAHLQVFHRSVTKEATAQQHVQNQLLPLNYIMREDPIVGIKVRLFTVD